jgi:hypothetical protein
LFSGTILISFCLDIIFLFAMFRVVLESSLEYASSQLF